MSIYQDSERDAADLAKLVNEDTDVTTRYGANPKISAPKAIRLIEASGADTVNQIQTDAANAIATLNTSRGFRVVGDFASGFTYELPNDVAVDASGNYWVYADINALPVTVSAGTAPSSPTYTQTTFNQASAVTTTAGINAQQFIDNFELKIFQSPTDNLTKVTTFSGGVGVVYEVRKTSDNSLATIYSDKDGVTEIVQNGTANVSNGDAEAVFYIADGDYYAVSQGESNNFSVDVLRQDLANPDKGAAMVQFIQPEAGSVTQSLMYRGRLDQRSSDYTDLQATAAAKRANASVFTLPIGTTALNGTLNLSGYHDISGQGDASVVQLDDVGGLRYESAAGVFDDHPHRKLRDFRVRGNGVYGGFLNPQTGTTTGYANTVHGSYSYQGGMTYELNGVGCWVKNGYTNFHSYNHYRGNKVGLKLENVTSHKEVGIYARYNSECAVDIIGGQNIQIDGGAIEGNRGIAIRGRDFLTASTASLQLINLYMEANGDEAAGVPSVDIEDSPNMSVQIIGGSYWRNINSGVTSGIYRWGTSVDISNAAINSAHYMRNGRIGPGVDLGASFNTDSELAKAEQNGLVEPAMISEFLPKRVLASSMFQVPVVGRSTRKLLDANLAKLIYPHVGSKSASVITSEAADLDYGDGSWTRVVFPTEAGNYGNNYAQVEYVADGESQFPAKVCIFLLRPETDMNIGLVASGNMTLFSAYFSLKAGVTYKMCAINTQEMAGDYRFRMFTPTAGGGTLGFLPIYTAKFTDADRAILFADMSCKGVV
tara:strand:+ start:710 stop:3016 length:2307 start_codon:yes stop_codon:yes gene_type:complete